MKADPVLLDKASRFDKIVQQARSTFKHYKKLADADKDRVRAIAEQSGTDFSLSVWEKHRDGTKSESYNRRDAHESYKVLMLANATDGLVCGCFLCEPIEKKEKVSA